jgi:CRISPR-associated endonuclease/helicase Cas3
VPGFASVLVQAAKWHDRGKNEPRFQALLHDESSPHFGDQPLAKSGRPASPRDRLLRNVLGITGFRHEMLSLQRVAEESDDPLLLHLIASHHGHARPFAPVFEDVIWTDPPPHHLGSGVAERFWALTRRHGWWGLAYLEAVLRLADQHASRFPVAALEEQTCHAEESPHA